MGNDYHQPQDLQTAYDEYLKAHPEAASDPATMNPAELTAYAQTLLAGEGGDNTLSAAQGLKVTSQTFNPGRLWQNYQDVNVGNWQQSNEPYELGGNSIQQLRVKNAMGDAQAYQDQIRGVEGQVNGALGEMYTTGRDALTRQEGYLDDAGNVQLKGVQQDQSLQGQGAYQDYLRSMSSGMQSADAQSAMAGKMADEYANPSNTAAQMQMRAATDANLNSNLALAHSGNNASSMARALTANAGAQQQAAAQSAMLQGQEMQSLRGAWGQAQQGATASYQGLGGLAAGTANEAAGTYQGAQKLNLGAQQQQQNFYQQEAANFGALAQGQQAQLGNYITGRQTQGNELQAQNAYFTQLAQAQQANKAAKNSLQYSEFTRQQAQRANMASQDYNGRLGAATQGAQMQQSQMNADRANNQQMIGVGLTTAGTVLGSLAGPIGAAAGGAAGAGAAKAATG